MAKLTTTETRPIVTIDYGHGPSSYYAAAGERTIGGDGSLFFEHMALTPLSRVTVQEHPVTFGIKAPSASGLTPEQEAGLQAVIRTAQGIERQQFVAARAIERVTQDTEIGRAVASHEFNLSVLEALHTGLSQEDIAIHLLKAGFNQLEEKVDDIQTLDTDVLYRTEA